MLLRNIMLVAGVLALLAGGVLAVFWLRAPAPQVVQQEEPVAHQRILVAARPIATGALLAAADLRWKDVHPDDVVPSNIVAGQIGEQELVGAVSRRAYQSGDALVESQMVKPTEGGFLAAVLAPTMRAVSITVGAAESVSGLVAPGDHVDVILTQIFDHAVAETARKSAGETVLHDVRVIAVDQALNGSLQAKGADVRMANAEPRIPKTITLEVTERQAERLLVATQLGKIDLAIRPFEARGDGTPQIAGIGSSPMETPPTWAFDVSPALRSLTRGAPTPNTPSATPVAENRTSNLPSIAVMRGSKVERLCSSSDRLATCGGGGGGGGAGGETKETK